MNVTKLNIKKNHFTVESAGSMRQLCANLFRHYKITTFRHVRSFYDGSRVELTTDEAWFVYFMEKGYFNYSRLDRHASCYTSGYFLWDAWNKDSTAYSIVMQEAIQQNGGCGISILRQQAQWVDKFDFSAPENRLGMNEFYLTNITLLDGFINQYLETAEKLIQQAHRMREHLPYSIDCYKEYDDTYLPTAILSAVNYQNPYTDPSSTNFTRRELQCIYWFSLGKTVPDIADILQISPRTVEKYILQIKEKLGCRTLFQVGQRIGRLKLDILLRNMDPRERFHHNNKTE